MTRFFSNSEDLSDIEARNDRKWGASRDWVNEGVGLPSDNEIEAIARRMSAEFHMLIEDESILDI